MGLLHLRGTLYSDKMGPRSEQVREGMKNDTLRLTNKLNMWKSWIGFNATHSVGAAFIGIMNFYLALRHFEFLRSSQFMLLFTLLTIGLYVWVAWRYWFKTVLVLLAAAWGCFLISYLLIVAG